MTEERKEYRRITDKEIYEVIEKVKRNEEGSVADALEALLAVAVDTRAFLRKVYKTVSIKRRKNIVKDPVKAKKNDIVIGENEVVSSQEELEK